PVGRGFAGRVAAERSPVAIDDVDHADVLNPLLREKGIRSLLGAPLIAERRLLGMIHVGTLRPRRFSSEEVELLQRVAARTALATDGAGLSEAEQAAGAAAEASADRLRRLQTVTGVALAQLGLDEFLAQLLARVCEVLAVDTCTVLLLDQERDELVAR